MKDHFRIAFSFLPIAIEKKLYSKYFRKEDVIHTAENKNGVSHLVKQKHLISLAKKNNLKTLVETGTYLGDMLFMLDEYFDVLYSIELSDFYYQKAKKRFSKNKKIRLLHGDSSEELANVVEQLNEPTLFWLDGHYSGGKTALGKLECPIYDELNQVFKSPFKHTIVVDDARLFVGKNDYPTTQALKDFVQNKLTDFTFDIHNDAIVITIK